jgi:hypothetical protein
MGHRGGGVLIRRLIGGLIGSSRFEQSGQIVKAQANYGAVHGDVYNFHSDGAKLPPLVERFTYRVDRHPQCAALLERISIVASRKRPICAIALGIEDDLPVLFGTTVLEFLNHKAAVCDLLAFLPARYPLCLQWPDDCVSGEDLWRAIGTRFLDLAALDPPSAAHREIERRAGSIAFGLEIDFGAWEKRADALKSWIETLEQCRAPAKGVALAIVVISGRDAAKIQDLHAHLTSQYKGHNRVIVLPVLGPVEQSEFKMWHRELMDIAANSAAAGDLAALMSELYPGIVEPKRMKEIWGPMRSKIKRAWGVA